MRALYRLTLRHPYLAGCGHPLTTRLTSHVSLDTMTSSQTDGSLLHLEVSGAINSFTPMLVGTWPIPPFHRPPELYFFPSHLLDVKLNLFVDLKHPHVAAGMHYIFAGRVCHSLLTPGHTCTYVSSSSANFASSSLSRYLPS